MYKLEEQSAAAGYKNYDLHWMPREVLPNSFIKTLSSKNDYQLKPLASSFWKYYTEAFDKIKAHCNGSCILPDNDPSKQKYVEVYAWEYMLSKSQSPDLDFARKMQQKEYLDCYVLLSNFHYDLLDQYRDFVPANKVKIRGYFELLKATGQ